MTELEVTRIAVVVVGLIAMFAGFYIAYKAGGVKSLTAKVNEVDRGSEMFQILAKGVSDSVPAETVKQFIAVTDKAHTALGQMIEFAKTFTNDRVDVALDEIKELSNAVDKLKDDMLTRAPIDNQLTDGSSNVAHSSVSPLDPTAKG